MKVQINNTIIDNLEHIDINDCEIKLYFSDNVSSKYIDEINNSLNICGFNKIDNTFVLIALGVYKMNQTFISVVNE